MTSASQTATTTATATISSITATTNTLYPVTATTNTPYPVTATTNTPYPTTTSAPYPIYTPSSEFPPISTTNAVQPEVQPSATQDNVPPASAANQTEIGNSALPPYPSSAADHVVFYQPTAIPNEPPPAYEPPKDEWYSGRSNNAANQNYSVGDTYRPAEGTIIAIPNTPYNPQFTAHAMRVQCPKCQRIVTTNVQYNIGCFTWFISGMLCLMGCWMGCACIPFCVHSTKDVRHMCPQCGSHIGTYFRL